MEGERHIDFPSGNVFLQMPNGTGKTTTLNLLRSVCIGSLWTSGSGDGKSGVTMSSLRRNISASGDKDSTSMATGIFKTRMEINGETFGFEIRLKHESGEEEWWTETPGGRRKGWHPPAEFKRTFEGNPRLAELFVFDAETARKVREKTDKSLLERAIWQFGGVSSVYDMIGYPDTSGRFTGGRYEVATELLRKEMGQLDGTSDGGKISGWLKCLEEAIKREGEINSKLRGARQDLALLNSDKAKIDKELQDIEDEWGGQLDGIKKQRDLIEDLDENLDAATRTLLLEFVNPSRVFNEEWSEISRFHREHQDRKLPATVGRGWLESLAESEQCICGTAFDNDMREHVRKHVDNFLSEHKMVAVSKMQSAFGDLISPDRGPLSAARELVDSLDSQRSEAQTKLENDFSGGLSEEVKTKREGLKHDLIELMVEIDDIKAAMKIAETDDIRWLHRLGRTDGLNANLSPTTQPATIRNIENLKILDIVRKNVEEKLSEAKGNRAIWDGLQESRGLIGKALNQLSNEMRGSVSEQATKVWKSMPAAQAEGGNLRIEIGSEGLKIFRQKGAETDVSGAQIVSACYAITRSIGNLGGIKFPLICDTPFAGFDIGMVGAWHSSIASSFEQAVALVNTGEKELLFLKVWDKGMGPDDYRGTMEQIGTDDDGGKLLKFTTDSDTFRNLQSAMDKMEE